MAKSIYARQGTTSDVVETEQNAAGVMTPILRVDPEDGTALQFLNYYATGSKAGIPFFAQFKDSNGDFLPGDTSVQFVLDLAGQTQDLIVSETIEQIQAFNTLSLSEQQNEETIDAIKIELEQPGSDANVESVRVRDVDEFRVEINSSEVVDHDESDFLFPQGSVKEMPR